MMSRHRVMVLSVLSIFLALPAWGQRPGTMETGRIALVPLAYFAPRSLREACNLLLSGQRQKAGPLFEAEVRRNPGNLIAYVGFVQAKPLQWKSERERLEFLLNKNPEDVDAGFKLGVILYYQWIGWQARFEHMDQIERAHDLLEKAWRKKKTLVTGFALIEVPKATAQKARQNRAILDEMIHDLIGDGPNEAYVRAAHNQWVPEPPSVTHLSVDQLDSLYAVVRKCWGEAGRLSGHAVMRNGHLTPEWDPVPPDKAREKHYFEVWQGLILKAKRDLGA